MLLQGSRLNLCPLQVLSAVAAKIPSIPSVVNICTVCIKKKKALFMWYEQKKSTHRPFLWSSISVTSTPANSCFCVQKDQQTTPGVCGWLLWTVPLLAKHSRVL
uniref:Uncharacterized protein n=1 Tax=Sphaerodactylus townsendi TaxID=933632 RepID=A0ACB8EI05_9SAUR